MDSGIRIRGETLTKLDLKYLRDYLRAQDEIQAAEFRQENVLGMGAHLSWLLFVAASAGPYVGKKALDLVVDYVREWLRASPWCLKRTVEIYGPDGSVVSVVECEENKARGKVCFHAKWRLRLHRILSAFGRRLNIRAK